MRKRFLILFLIVLGVLGLGILGMFAYKYRTHPTVEETCQLREAYLKLSQTIPWNNLNTQGLDAWETNFDLQSLEQILDDTTSSRIETIDQLKKQNPNVAEPLNELAKAYDEYVETASRLTSEELGQVIKSQGVLDFRILPNSEEISFDQWVLYKTSLHRNGPEKAFGDTEDYVWCKIQNPQRFPEAAIRATYEGVEYVLASNQSHETMSHRPDQQSWQFEKLHLTTDHYGKIALGFTLDEKGIRRFWELTKNNKDRFLCIVLNNTALSAPTIREPIYGQGLIQGMTKRGVLEMIGMLQVQKE